MVETWKLNLTLIYIENYLTRMSKPDLMNKVQTNSVEVFFCDFKALNGFFSGYSKPLNWWRGDSYKRRLV
jgi:hypothetical protein